MCCFKQTRLAAAQAESACHTPDEERKEKRTEAKRPEILHKSSKELYRAVAAQWGITCKMSDHCRCLDCQVGNTGSKIIHTVFM
jgi:hypothetical protein